MRDGSSVQQQLPLVEAEITGESPAGVRRLEVDVVRSPRRRSLAVHVSPFGRVEVRAPAWSDPREIAAFLERHRDWILRKVGEAEQAPPWQPRWEAGGQWYWQGETVTLAGGGPRGGRLAGGVLALPLREGRDEAAWRTAVMNWHRREASRLLAARIGELFAHHCAGHRLQAVHIRWMRMTWGTCHARRAPDLRRDVKIRLNPWLAALPPALCDAVLLHELAHVEHMNHGTGFYRRLAVLDPDWEAHDEALKTWSRRLFPIAAR